MRSERKSAARRALAICLAAGSVVLAPGCVLDWNGLRAGNEGGPGEDATDVRAPDVRDAGDASDAADARADAGDAGINPDAADARDVTMVDGTDAADAGDVQDVPTTNDAMDVLDGGDARADATDVVIAMDVVDAQDVRDVTANDAVDVPTLDTPEVGVDVPRVDVIDVIDVIDVVPVDVLDETLVDAMPEAGDDACVPVVVINEVQTGGSGTGTTGNEFVELHNTGGCDVPLNGWSLHYRSAAGTSDSVLWRGAATDTLVAGGYWLIGGQGYTGTVDGRITSSSTGALSGTGGGVALFTPTGGTPTDSVGYGTATNAFVESAAAPAPAGGSSISRTPDGTDTNNNSADFVVTMTPTPDAPNP